VAVMHVHRSATIEVPDIHNLRAAWKTYGGPLCLVSRFVVQKPLTQSQLQRLPKALRELVSCPDDSVAWLERLYGLEDPRP
jgi:hypothetical protein